LKLFVLLIVWSFTTQKCHFYYCV